VADNISHPVSLSAWLRAPVPTSSWQARAQQLWLSWRVLRSNPSVMFGGTVILAVAVIAIFAPLFATHDIYAQDLSIRLQKPSMTHWLGTDELGRDVYSRLLFGARITLYIAGLTAIIAAPLGLLVGTTAGYVGGWVNMGIMRTIDVFFAFPSILLAIALSGALGAGIANAVVALTMVFIPPITRVAESVTTQIRTRDYVEAARVSGAGVLTIIRVHVLGNVLGPIFVYATSLISVSMILASGLSFLGLGSRPPEPEWGLMLNTLRTAIYVQPAVAALPGVMIFITSISFNLLSDGLRSAMEVRS